MADSMRSGSRGREVLHTILFADLCGFTRYTYEHGDEPAARLALGFHGQARLLAARERCRVVKSIGDAVMVHSTRCLSALRLAQGILVWAAGDQRPSVRIGVDVGPAIEHRGDWYGCTVNTAARIAETALPGEIVLTERVLEILSGGGHIDTVGLGTRRLKGLPAMRLYATVPTGGPRGARSAGLGDAGADALIWPSIAEAAEHDGAAIRGSIGCGPHVSEEMELVER